MRSEEEEYSVQFPPELTMTQSVEVMTIYGDVLKLLVRRSMSNIITRGVCDEKLRMGQNKQGSIRRN